MPIVTVKNKFQVVIPRAVREELRIKRGDVLEARAERGKLTYTRKTVVDQAIPTSKTERAKFLKRLKDEAPEWLKLIQEGSQRRGTDALTMRQINAEISPVRRGRLKQKRSA
jgi:AbrB family looped-hinge helix DNA binding protein